MGIVKVNLIHKKDGPFRIRVYNSDNYYIKLYNDGVDTVADVTAKNVAMPSLEMNRNNVLINFPINGYGVEDVSDLIKSLNDMPDLLETLNVLKEEIERR